MRRLTKILHRQNKDDLCIFVSVARDRPTYIAHHNNDASHFYIKVLHFRELANQCINVKLFNLFGGADEETIGDCRWE